MDTQNTQTGSGNGSGDNTTNNASYDGGKPKPERIPITYTLSQDGAPSDHVASADAFHISNEVSTGNGIFLKSNSSKDAPEVELLWTPPRGLLLEEDYNVQLDLEPYLFTKMNIRIFSLAKKKRIRYVFLRGTARNNMLKPDYYSPELLLFVPENTPVPRTVTIVQSKKWETSNS